MNLKVANSVRFKLFVQRRIKLLFSWEEGWGWGGGLVFPNSKARVHGPPGPRWCLGAIAPVGGTGWGHPNGIQCNLKPID
jgi:hypothetical protein